MDYAIQKPRISTIKKLLAIFGLLLCLTNCAVHLAPDYDQQIVDGLRAVNSQTQILFASIGTGVTKETYPNRQEAYTDIIGQLNALELEAKLRPTPQSKTLSATNKLIGENKLAIANPNANSTVPSLRAIADAVATITQMQEADKNGELQGTLVVAFKNQINIFISQALAYEKFLNRERS